MTRRDFLLAAVAAVLGTYLATYLVRATDWTMSQLPVIVGAFVLTLEWAAEIASNALPQSALSLHTLLSMLFVLPFVFLRQLGSPLDDCAHGPPLALGGKLRRERAAELMGELNKGTDYLARQQRMERSLYERLVAAGALMERPSKPVQDSSARGTH
jgi:hypothetical protein